MSNSIKPTGATKISGPRSKLPAPLDPRRRMLRKVGSMLVIVGAALLISAWFAWRKQPDPGAEHIIAAVVETGHSDASPASWPTVQFTAPNGSIVRITGALAKNTQYALGDHVPVLYDAFHPERTHIEEADNPAMQVYGLGALGALFVVFGVAFSIYLRRQARSV